MRATLAAWKTVRVPSGRTKSRPRSPAPMPAASYALPSSSWERICTSPAVALIVVKVVEAAAPQIASVTTIRYVVDSSSWEIGWP